MEENRYSYDRFGSKGQRVGQAVYDILSRDQPAQTCQETLEAIAPKYTADLEAAIEKDRHRYTSPFYVLVLTKKEMWAVNVMRNYFIPRQTAPRALDMVTGYPHYVKTLYKVDSQRGRLQVNWSIPGIEDCKSIVKNPQIHDPELVSWINDCFTGSLDSPELELLSSRS